MDQNEYIEANRRMWNETAGLHAQAYVNDLAVRIRAPDFTTFDEIEKGLFEEIGLEGKAVAQLCCNNGRELIAVKKAGAGRCVGFDVSDEFIAQGRRLADASESEVELVRSSVYEIATDHDGQFDLVYVTIGALGWLPDIASVFRVIVRLLKPGGHLFIYEMHPVLNMFDPEKGLEVGACYFRKEPFRGEDEPDYMDPSKVVQSTSYWFPHTMADVIGGCLRNGLDLTHFEEYDHDISMTYAPFAQFETKPPMCYSLVARKKA